MVSEPTHEALKSRWRPSPRLAAGVVMGLLALTFILQNTGSMRVHLLFMHIDNPAWVWLLALFAAGFVVGSAFPWFRRRTATPGKPPGP